MHAAALFFPVEKAYFKLEAAMGTAFSIGINSTAAHAPYEAAICEGKAVELRARPQRKNC